MNEQDAKTAKDVYDIIDKYIKLQEQIDNPTRQGMINALMGAQSIAFSEVKYIENEQGNIVRVPWDYFSDDDLYSKLPYYQTALRNKAISMIGEKTFEELLNVIQKEQWLK